MNEEKMTDAILVGLQTDQRDDRFESAMDELALLAESSNINTAAIITQKAATPVSATYIGKGKLEEVKEAVNLSGASLVIFDQTLTPSQFNNLSKEIGVEVMDRTGLILRIFSEQARTREARLQVELANLQYILPRLAGMWTHFGKQGGTSGSMSNRGVGETQIELDRRHIQHRMSELERELKVVDNERKTQRSRRLSDPIPKIAVAGYTNAGKSTLMNRLLDMNEGADENKQVYEHDSLFATLDTSVRRIAIKGRRPFLLIDTVGFINELPHTLVKAFRSTLEETLYADLILEVVDISDPEYRQCMHVTDETLAQIGAGAIPRLTVYNKCDKADLPFSYPTTRPGAVYISAARRSGLDLLLDTIEEHLAKQRVQQSFVLPYNRGDLLNRLIESGDAQTIEYKEDGVHVTALLRPVDVKYYM